MPDVKLIASRHSAFYSPLISLIAGGFLEKEGLSATYTPAAAGQNSAIEVAEGRADIVKRMLKQNTAITDIAKATGLPIADIKKLKAKRG